MAFSPREVGIMLGQAWESVQCSRHPDRITAVDCVSAVCDYFFELKGDRSGKDDPAILTGLGTISNYRVALAAHEKGAGIGGRKRCNLGMPRPEGYRKAQRLFSLAEKLSLPLLCLVDTPGAYPGLEAEEGGQAWAISRSLAMLVSLQVPVVVVFMGEGGSGGALALGIGDALLMLEKATFSVISPEGCASILWRDQARAPQAADMLQLTSERLSELGLVDEIVAEGDGEARRETWTALVNLRRAIIAHLGILEGVPVPALIERRKERYRKVGVHAVREGEPDARQIPTRI